MRKILLTVFLTILSMIIIFVVLPFCLGYRIIWETNIQYDYQAIGAWGTWVGGIGTMLAVAVTMSISMFLPKYKNIKVKFIMDNNNSKLKLVIANTGNSSIILNEIHYCAKKLYLEGTGFIEDEHKKIDKATVIDCGCATIIDINETSRLWYYRGHITINDREFNQKIIVKLLDFSGKKFTCKTKITLQELDEFYDKYFSYMNNQENGCDQI